MGLFVTRRAYFATYDGGPWGSQTTPSGYSGHSFCSSRKRSRGPIRSCAAASRCCAGTAERVAWVPSREADTMTKIRHTHPDGFRSGEWATLKGMAQDGPREVYQVRFDDGVVDWWAVEDPLEPYEFDMDES